MQVELHINGRLNIELIPENEIETLVLKSMLAYAEKGKAVRLTASPEVPGVLVSVEK